MTATGMEPGPPGFSERPGRRRSAPPPAGSAARQPLTVEAALLALGDTDLATLRDGAVALATQRTGADAVFLVDLAGPGGRIAALAGEALAPGAPITAAPPDLALLRAARVALVTRARGRRGNIAQQLRAQGFTVAIAASLGVHGVSQLLIAARRQGGFGPAARRSLARVAAIVAGAEKQHGVSQVAERRFRQQSAVAALGQRALAGEDLDALIQAACEAAVTHLDADVAHVLERAADGLVIRGAAGTEPAAIGSHLPMDASFAARVMASGQPLVISDVASDPLYARATLAHQELVASLVIVPIQSGRRPSGVLAVVSRSASSFAEHEISFVQGLANVVALTTERERAQSQLRLSIEELRKSAEDRSRLLAHIVEAQEEERRRIADDIHDDSVQVMTAVALRLATLRRRLDGEAPDPLLTNLEHDVRQSIARLRHLMFVLRPPALENQGMASALQAFLAQVADEAGLAYTLEDRLQGEPRTETRIVVYRIAQEAVSNVLKHARATRVDVTLEEDLSGVLVSIRDDGAGFDARRPERSLPGHLGLLVMRERAEQTGGWCIVDSEPGQGTTVRYCVGSAVARRHEPPLEASMTLVP
jgi:signal transduction histidine kinase